MKGPLVKMFLAGVVSRTIRAPIMKVNVGVRAMEAMGMAGVNPMDLSCNGPQMMEWMPLRLVVLVGADNIIPVQNVGRIISQA